MTNTGTTNPTLTPTNVYLMDRRGGKISWVEGTVPIREAIEISATDTWTPIPTTQKLSFRIKGDPRALYFALGLPLRRWKKLSYRTIRALCAKRNK